MIKGHSQVGEPEPLSGGPIPRSWMLFLAQQSQGSAAVKKERRLCFALHQISRSRALDISRAHAPVYVGHTAIFVCELSSTIHCTFYYIPCCIHHLPQLCRISSNLFDSKNQRPTTVKGNTIRNRAVRVQTHPSRAWAQSFDQTKPRGLD